MLQAIRHHCSHEYQAKQTRSPLLTVCHPQQQQQQQQPPQLHSDAQPITLHINNATHAPSQGRSKRVVSTYRKAFCQAPQTARHTHTHTLGAYARLAWLRTKLVLQTPSGACVSCRESCCIGLLTSTTQRPQSLARIHIHVQSGSAPGQSSLPQHHCDVPAEAPCPAAALLPQCYHSCVLRDV